MTSVTSEKTSSMKAATSVVCPAIEPSILDSSSTARARGQSEREGKREGIFEHTADGVYAGLRLARSGTFRG
eukprot:720544-Prymnesium_polylepis.1